MKKDFDGRRQTLSAILPVLAAAVVLIGCGHQKSDPADATAISQESQTESETQQEAVSTETEADKTADSSTEIEAEQTTDSSTDAEWIENIMLATDIHYFSDSLTDGGPRFQEMVEYGDGKIVTYIDQITDAFLDEVVKQHPDALVLSGDLTLNGEKASHKDLAEKLHRVENHGIPVLVIPGNHDTKKRIAEMEKLGWIIENKVSCIDYNDVSFIMIHERPEEMRGDSANIILYGHVHDAAPKGIVDWTYHVGIDTNSLTPVNIHDIWFDVQMKKIETGE